MITAWNVLARLEHFIDIDSDSKDKALSICFEIKKDSLKQLLPLLKDENFFITLA